MIERALSVTEVADRLGIRRHGVLALIHSGELRARDLSQTPGGRPLWRILPEDLEALLNRRASEAQPKRRRRRKVRTPVKRYF